MRNPESDLRTLRGYHKLRQKGQDITPGMEDYLEMACRLSGSKGYTRIGDLAAALNVQPPSASKMVQKLSGCGYFLYNKYGVVELTPEGKRLGSYLIRRHDIIESFLKMIGVNQGVWEETEKMEHTLTEQTVQKIAVLVSFLEKHRNLLEDFQSYPGKIG